MASSWFVHAIEQFNNSGDYWSLSTTNASLVADVTGPLSVDSGWRTIGQFKTNTGNPSLINQQEITTKQSPSWRDVDGTFRWTWAFLDAIDFGIVANLRQVAGVLLHEGVNTDDNANIIAFHENQVGGLGGSVNWGQAGFNNLMHTTPVNDGGVLTFHGGLRQQDELANAWDNGAGGNKFGFALCQGPSTLDGTEHTMADTVGKVNYCTNAGPGQAAAHVLTLPTDTVAPAWEAFTGGTRRLDYILSALGTQVKWLWTNGLAEETITGVLMYMYQDPYSNGTAFPWHYDPTTSHTIITNQDIRYGDISSGQILLTTIKG